LEGVIDCITGDGIVVKMILSILESTKLCLVLPIRYTTRLLITLAVLSNLIISIIAEFIESVLEFWL
jgi:hypothetical protein